jgi:hypothetical protein
MLHSVCLWVHSWEWLYRKLEVGGLTRFPYCGTDIHPQTTQTKMQGWNLHTLPHSLFQYAQTETRPIMARTVGLALFRVLPQGFATYCQCLGYLNNGCYKARCIQSSPIYCFYLVDRETTSVDKLIYSVYANLGQWKWLLLELPQIIVKAAALFQLLGGLSEEWYGKIHYQPFQQLLHHKPKPNNSFYCLHPFLVHSLQALVELINVGNVVCHDTMTTLMQRSRWTRI